jgi:hypothetical protein
MDTHNVTAPASEALPRIMADLGMQFANAPLHRIEFEIDSRGIQRLADHYNDRIFRAHHNATDGNLTWDSLLLRFDGRWLVAFGDGRDYAEVLAPTSDGAKTLFEDAWRVLHGPQARRHPAFYMLRHECGDFTADPVENLPEAVDDDFLRLCYGDDILEWLSGFEERTVERAGGLTIFEGPPGTGKTSLLTQMVRRLEKTHVFYALPAANDGALSSPDLVPFWQKQNARHADKVKVIMLEDAERLLWRRGSDNRESVSSLLNIADGMIGRMLRLHIICSVNARMEDLDPAILRPGRLTHHRRFGLLKWPVAQKVALARGLSFAGREGVMEYTLAEVLNPTAGWTPPQERPRIGFRVPAVA